MPKLRAHNISVSLDGYMAGPRQSLDDPLGVGGTRLHEWAYATKSFHAMTGEPGGEEGLDEGFMRAGVENIGATIMGRNMFGPVRGVWGDSDWKGWWGDEPPYHHPVYVLTHHAHEPIAMRGGTTFHFVTDGPRSAFDRAFAAADGKDVRLGGGAATIQEFVRAGLLDELHIAIVPLLLGAGERLFDQLGGRDFDLRCVELVSSESVVHARFARPNEPSRRR